MKYWLITLSAAFIILLICFIICQQEVKVYEEILEEEESLITDIISLDSLEKLAMEVNVRNKLRHQDDLKRIDSLSSVCQNIQHTHQAQQSYDSYTAEIATTIIKDTTIYRKRFKDTIIYKSNYIYVNDTVYKTIEVVDTIYRRVRQRRNN